MEATEQTLEADEERFQKNLLADQNNFQDRLDSLNMAVAGFAAHTDISKAHEIANDVRRLVKQMKECQTLAHTYNNRERLFNLPVTSVSVYPLTWIMNQHITTQKWLYLQKCRAQLVNIVFSNSKEFWVSFLLSLLIGLNFESLPVRETKPLDQRFRAVQEHVVNSFRLAEMAR